MLSTNQLEIENFTSRQTVACGCGKRPKIQSKGFKLEFADTFRVLINAPGLYTHKPLHVLDRIITPALLLNQYKIFRHAKLPVGFMSWGFLSDEIHTGWMNRTHNLQSDDFNTGDNLWIIDFCTTMDAPPNLPMKMLRYMKTKFDPRPFHWKRWDMKKNCMKHIGQRNTSYVQP